MDDICLHHQLVGTIGLLTCEDRAFVWYCGSPLNWQARLPTPWGSTYEKRIMEDAMQTAQSFCFTTGLRGFHVYSTTKGWKPYLQQKITFKREHNNVHDRFAVSGLTTLRGTLAPVVVGHIPRELSRYVWYALQKGAKFTGEVIAVKAKRSPLIQGGLEIPIKVVVQWSDSRNLSLLKQRTEQVSYPIETDYTDDSKSILAEIQEADVENYISSDSENEDNSVELQ